MQKNLFLAASFMSLSLATAAFAQSGAAGSMNNGSAAPSASSAAPSSSSTARHHTRAHHAARTGGGVRQAQQTLQSQGLYQGNVDGKYGPKTRQAVMQFQKQNNITANGRLDRATRVALRGGSSSAGMTGGNRGHDNMGNTGGSPSNATSANPNNNADARTAPSGSSMVPQGAGAPKSNPGAMQPAN